MNLKLLENIKNLNLEEDDLNNIADLSYQFYAKNVTLSIADNNLKSDLTKQKAFSNFVRFYRCLNSNKKVEEEVFQNYLKESFKGKLKFSNLLNGKVQEIISIQNHKISYADKIEKRVLNNVSGSVNKKTEKYADFLNNMRNNYHLLKKLSSKIIVTISNNLSNRVLVPEIYLFITLEDGRTLEMFVEIKTFQEFRKCLAVHIKKIIDNEGINLLK